MIFLDPKLSSSATSARPRPELRFFFHNATLDRWVRQFRVQKIITKRFFKILLTGGLPHRGKRFPKCGVGSGNGGSENGVAGDTVGTGPLRGDHERNRSATRRTRQRFLMIVSRREGLNKRETGRRPRPMNPDRPKAKERTTTRRKPPAKSRPADCRRPRITNGGPGTTVMRCGSGKPGVEPGIYESDPLKPKETRAQPNESRRRTAVAGRAALTGGIVGAGGVVAPGSIAACSPSKAKT